MTNRAVHILGKIIEGTFLQPFGVYVYNSIIGPKKVKIDVEDTTFKFSILPADQGIEDLGGEIDVIREVVKKIDDDDIIWDIGANMGWHAVVFGHWGSIVYAFEPNPDALNTLIKNSQLNPNSRVLPIMAGLSSETTHNELITNINAGKTGSIEKGEDLFDKRILSQFISGSELLKGMQVPDVLKVDVEGHEMEVIYGFGEYLKDIEMIALEEHSGNPIDREYFRKNGFELVFEDERGKEKELIFEAEG
ncbi:MAG: FkbM family methyltransferase [Halobacteriaceae archaeon]